MGSPLEVWEGAEAYFTFADSPVMMGILLVLAVGVSIASIVVVSKHEAECYKDIKK